MYYRLEVLEYVWEKGDGAILQTKELDRFNGGNGRNLLGGLKNRGILTPAEGVGYKINLPPNETAAQWQKRINEEFIENCRAGARKSGYYKAIKGDKWNKGVAKAREQKLLRGNLSESYELLQKAGFYWNQHLSEWLPVNDKPTGILRRKKT